MDKEDSTGWKLLTGVDSLYDRRHFRKKIFINGTKLTSIPILTCETGTEFGTPDHLEAIQRLRKTCVDYIRLHYEDFHHIILSEVCEMKHITQQEISLDEQRAMVDEYISNLLVNRSWCGAETIIAVGKIYNVNIIVFTEDGSPLVFESPNGGNFNVNLFFSGHPVKNHYDVVVRVPEQSRKITQSKSALTGCRSEGKCFVYSGARI